MKNLEKIIELGVEGGSVSIYKYLDEKGNDFYYHHTQEMGWDDLELQGVDNRSKYTSISFPEAMIVMIGEYNNAMSFYPVFVHLDFKPVIVEFLKSYRKDIEMQKDRWFEILKIEETDLDKDILKQFE